MPKDIYFSLSEGALEELRSVKKVFRVAVQGVRLCALPDLTGLVAIQLRQGAGFQPGTSQVADDTAEEIQLLAQELQSKDFAPLLRSSLLHAYSAFEFFFKALYVDYARKDPTVALGLSSALKVRVSANLLLQESPEERLFLLADEAWQQISAGKKFSARCLHFLSVYCDPALINESKAVFEKSCNHLDQLHDLRIALTHHGGRGRSENTDQTIELSRKQTNLFLNALIEYATSVFDASPFPATKQI